MKSWLVRPARNEDLPALTRLLPGWEAESAALVDDDGNDPMLLACPLGNDHIAGAPAACLRLRRRVGLTQPRYWFHVGYRVHAAAELGMFRRERTLLLGNDHTGAAELADFGIDAARLQPAQRAALPRLLIGAALLLLHRDQRTGMRSDALPRVIATLPGQRDEDGAAPFWEGLGRHFYPGDVAQALARFGHLWRTHVAALLPRHPLVVSVLREDAQAAIGGVHADAEPWRAALGELGLRAGQHVDLHDAGPVYEAHLDLLGCSPAMRLRTLRLANAIEAPRALLLATENADDIWQLPGELDGDGQVAIASDTAARLGWSPEQTLWVGE